MVSQCIRVQVCFVSKGLLRLGCLGCPELVDDLACIAEVELLYDQFTLLELL